MPSRVTVMGIAVLALLGMPASADPWKDESGKGKWRGTTTGRMMVFDADEIVTAKQTESRVVTCHHRENVGRGIAPGHQPPPYRC